MSCSSNRMAWNSMLLCVAGTTCGDHIYCGTGPEAGHRIRQAAVERLLVSSRAVVSTNPAVVAAIARVCGPYSSDFPSLLLSLVNTAHHWWYLQGRRNYCCAIRRLRHYHSIIFIDVTIIAIPLLTSMSMSDLDVYEWPRYLWVISMSRVTSKAKEQHFSKSVLKKSPVSVFMVAKVESRQVTLWRPPQFTVLAGKRLKDCSEYMQTHHWRLPHTGLSQRICRARTTRNRQQSQPVIKVK